jgi:hypothetical protein
MSREHLLLVSSLEEANSDARSKAGEISIIRANQAKAAKEFDRKVTALQQQHADEVGRQRAEIEATRAEKDRIITENKFLARDLTEEGHKVKSMKRNMRSNITNTSPITTPKKTKSAFHRDGFDDDEIITISPSRSFGEKIKATTPGRAASKRKRKTVEDSPSLQLSVPRQDSIDDGTTLPPGEPMLDMDMLKSLSIKDEKFDVSNPSSLLYIWLLIHSIVYAKHAQQPSISWSCPHDGGSNEFLVSI